jgi:hypothetical protein
MDFLIGFSVLILGLLGVFYPSVLYKSDLLTPQQIERNRRIWKHCGMGLITFSLVLLAIKLSWK